MCYSVKKITEAHVYIKWHIIYKPRDLNWSATVSQTVWNLAYKSLWLSDYHPCGILADILNAWQLQATLIFRTLCLSVCLSLPLCVSVSVCLFPPSFSLTVLYASVLVSLCVCVHCLSLEEWLSVKDRLWKLCNRFCQCLCLVCVYPPLYALMMV